MAAWSSSQAPLKTNAIQRSTFNVQRSTFLFLFLFLLLASFPSCRLSPDYLTRNTLRRASPIPHTIRTAEGPEIFLPLVPLTPLERAARDEDVAILTLRGLK